MSRNDLPVGTVTFLFTDIEGSTKLLHAIGVEAYTGVLAEHRRLLRDAFTRHGGVEVDTQGDAFFVAFPTAPGAVEAAREAQAALAPGPIRVRMGIHTGTPHVAHDGYVGEDVHKGARIAAAGHGDQVLLSRETRGLVQIQVTDLGEHRVKDFAAPVWIFQLGNQSFPPLKTISNTNLPRPVSSFVGREREVAEVVSFLQDGARLLTLTGPGGSGKTRLAIEAAAELVPNFKNGVFWVGLATIRDPTILDEAVAKTIGAKEGLSDHIGEREMLLLLDNFEQVVEAAPQLTSLLEVCPDLKLLVTSRELLRVEGELEYAVPPLAEPEAIELFCTRSGSEPDETIAELCRRLDALPLAMELAAARSSVLSPAQILSRLSERLDLLEGGRGAERRQQTLRATIDWSYDLLSKEEKTLFARLSVFAGGCTVDAAEAVCEADLDVLQSVVEKSLVRHTGERFWMLEIIREYADERLEDSGEAEGLRERHAEHFLSLVEEAEPSILGASPQGWLERLEQDHDNLRAAMDRLELSGDTQRALQVGGAMWEFWCLRGHAAEGRRRLEHLLALDERQTPARAKTLLGSAHLAPPAGAGEAAERVRAEEALALYRRLGDAWGVAFAEFEVALAFAAADDFAAAQPLTEESVRRLREVGDEHRALQATRVLAWCHLELEDVEGAKALYRELLDGARAAGDTQMQARALNSLSSVAIREGRPLDVLSLIEEAFRIDREFGDPSEIAVDLIYLAQSLAMVERAGDAARLLSRSDSIREDLGISHPAWILRLQADAMNRTHVSLDDAEFAEAWEQGRKLSTDEAVALALGSPSPARE